MGTLQASPILCSQEGSVSGTSGSPSNLFAGHDLSARAAATTLTQILRSCEQSAQPSTFTPSTLSLTKTTTRKQSYCEIPQVHKCFSLLGPLALECLCSIETLLTHYYAPANTLDEYVLTYLEDGSNSTKHRRKTGLKTNPDQP